MLLISQKSSCNQSILFQVQTQTQTPSTGLRHPLCVCLGVGVGRASGGEGGWMHVYICWRAGGGQGEGGDWTCAYIPSIRPHCHIDIKQRLSLSLRFCLHLHRFCQHTAQWCHPSVTIPMDSVNTPSLTIPMDSVNTPSLTIPRDSVNTPSVTIPMDSVNIHHRETPPQVTISMDSINMYQCENILSVSILFCQLCQHKHNKKTSSQSQDCQHSGFCQHTHNAINLHHYHPQLSIT